MWKDLNQIIHNLNVNDNITSNRKEIANTLNMFFKDIGKSLYSDIPILNTQLNVESHEFTASSMWLYSTSPSEVDLKNSKTVKDYISTDACKLLYISLAPLLAKLINDKFKNSTFLDSLNCSRIIPLHKDGNPLFSSIYRQKAYCLFSLRFLNLSFVTESIILLHLTK